MVLLLVENPVSQKPSHLKLVHRSGSMMGVQSYVNVFVNGLVSMETVTNGFMQYITIRDIFVCGTITVKFVIIQL